MGIYTFHLRTGTTKEQKNGRTEGWKQPQNNFKNNLKSLK